ncbi:MAG: cytochrome B, partial [Ignavibacteriae bacterium]|nr:cytochrome B [Ignavibacteriota bacterium]
PIPFFPNFMYRDLIAWSFGLLSLIGLAVMMPWGLGHKADPLASAPLGIRPEWYFLPLYQSLRMVPARMFSISGELLVNSLVAVATAVWIMIPFLDRQSNKGKQSRVFSILGVLIMLFLLTTILLAYTT